MKILVRHPPWETVNGGEPTPEGIRALLAKVAPVIDADKKNVLVVSTGVPRTDRAAQAIADKFQLRSPLVIPELGPLRTANFLPVFGRRLFNVLQKSQGINRLALYFWAISDGLIPFFTERPTPFQARMRNGLGMLLRSAGDSTIVIVIMHQEGFAVARADSQGTSLAQALKQEVPHLHSIVFEI